MQRPRCEVARLCAFGYGWLYLANPDLHPAPCKICVNGSQLLRPDAPAGEFCLVVRCAEAEMRDRCEAV